MRIISVYDINMRIADPLSKIIWKYNYKNKIRISFQNIITSITNQ